MKKISISGIAALFIATILFAVLSCKTKSQSDAGNSPTNTDDKQKAKTGSSNIPEDIKSILGEWRLVRKLRDDNGNHKIDADEENAEIKSNNYMKFNADGTCKFEEIMDGTFEIIIEEDGRKRVSIHDMKGSAYPYSLYILSVTENDLMINSIMGGGSQFEIYKRP